MSDYCNYCTNQLVIGSYYKINIISYNNVLIDPLINIVMDYNATKYPRYIKFIDVFH